MFCSCFNIKYTNQVSKSGYSWNGDDIIPLIEAEEDKARIAIEKIQYLIDFGMNFGNCFCIINKISTFSIIYYIYSNISIHGNISGNHRALSML